MNGEGEHQVFKSEDNVIETIRYWYNSQVDLMPIK